VPDLDQELPRGVPDHVLGVRPAVEAGKSQQTEGAVRGWTRTGSAPALGLIGRTQEPATRRLECTEPLGRGPWDDLLLPRTVAVGIRVSRREDRDPGPGGVE
jgi:hypothetical protein